jgi:intracellular multiplication protein IcmO
LEADKKGAQQIVANTNTKIFMKLADPEKTFELLKNLAGSELLMTTEGYEHQDGGYQDNIKASAQAQNRVDLRDLMEQVEGEAHIVWNGKLIRANTFFADPELSAALRVGRKLQLPSLDQKEREI